MSVLQLEPIFAPVYGGGIQNVASPMQLIGRNDQVIAEKILDMYYWQFPKLPAILYESHVIKNEQYLLTNFLTLGVLVTGALNLSIAKANPNKKYTLDHIDIGNQVLPFTKPLIANISLDKDVFLCTNEELGIETSSFNLDGCIKDFKSEVAFVYNEYGKEDDNRLTKDAKELKRKILSHLKE